jgi:hypothetical protein
MNARFGIAAIVLALGALAGACASASTALRPVPPSRRCRARTPSTLDDQTELALTVYNSDLALVRDVRNIQLPRGTFDLRFMDIAATVNPATVHIRSLTEPTRLDVLEQNYEYDLLEPDKLLRKYVGRDVTLVRLVQSGGTTKQEEVKARLLSYNNAPVWQIGNEIVTGMFTDHIRFPELPWQSLLASNADLVARERRRRASPHRSVLSRHQAVVECRLRAHRGARRHVSRRGWLGDAHQRQRHGLPSREAATGRRRAESRAAQFDRMEADMKMAASRTVAERMSQESFSDYHLYTLDRKTTVNNNETKQVSMLEATGFPVKKRYIVDGQSFYYRNVYRPGSPIKDPVQVFYQFKNEEKAGLGMPMPAGVIRVYQNDSKGGTHFVGEDRIDHTPKDEMLNLKIGSAFDIVSERKQTDFEKIASNVYEVEHEVVLRNHKTTPVTVEVNEPIGGTWRIIRSTHEYTKTDAWAAQFNVSVPADGSTTLKYRVRVTY